MAYIVLLTKNSFYTFWFQFWIMKYHKQVLILRCLLNGIAFVSFKAIKISTWDYSFQLINTWHRCQASNSNSCTQYSLLNLTTTEILWCHLLNRAINFRNQWLTKFTWSLTDRRLFPPFHLGPCVIVSIVCYLLYYRRGFVGKNLTTQKIYLKFPWRDKIQSLFH